jgi:sec-independent protein translocase protein TatC
MTRNRNRKTHDQDRMTLMEHLGELRKRLFVGAASIALCMLAAAILQKYVFKLLLHPLPSGHKEIITFSPSEPLLVSLQVWLYSGLILAAPIVIYEFWAFVGPAFTTGERKRIIPIAGITAFLFLGGIAFGYWAVLPRGLSFLLGWNSDFFHAQVRAADYLSFAAWFLVAFGAVFEMPVILVGLVSFGVIDVRFLRKHRRAAIVINAAVAAIATPSQDAFSMLAMFVPLVVLYEVAIIVSAILVRRRRKAMAAKMAAIDADLDEPPDQDGVSPTPA